MKPCRLQLLLLFILSLSVFGQIQNGDFELGDPNADPNVLQYFTPPADWVVASYPPPFYAALHSSFVPVYDPNREATEPNLADLNWIGPEPFEGSLYLLLSTGSMNIWPDNLIMRSEARQFLGFVPGNSVIRGAYFFGTTDYRPFNDMGIIQLIPYLDPCTPDPNGPFILASCSVDDVGDYQCTDGWQTFSYTLDASEGKYYEMVLSVEDGSDSIFESYFAVDGLSICGPGVVMGDINGDCFVDLLDFSILSQYWLLPCVEPNIPPDPNLPEYYFYPTCLLADLDESLIVEPNDLELMSQNWLKSEED
jgi:hypothetical protein